MLAGHGLRPGGVAAQDRLLQLATQAGGQTDESLGVFGEQLLVDPRPVVVALEVGGGDQLDQVAVAGLVARQQHQVIRVAVGAHLAVVARTLRHVHLAADDRVDVRGLRPRIEINDSVQHAVVGDAHRGLAHGVHAIDQFRDARSAVEQ